MGRCQEKDNAMREIKFRAWAWDTQYPDYEEKNYMLNVESINFESQVIILPYKIHKYRVDKLSNVVLMQYTGLKEKNGVEVFEGDIVRFSPLCEEHYEEPGMSIGSVTYGDGCFYISDKNGNGITMWDDGTHHWVSVEHLNFEGYFAKEYAVEVVGNIYENPKLIKS